MGRKGIDSATRFVRDRLLPQDRVAVMAYNRATDFTTDRAADPDDARALSTVRDQIEALMRQQFSGLQAAYGTNGAPNKNLQGQIDKVFRGPGTAAARRLPPGTPTDAAMITADQATRCRYAAACRSAPPGAGRRLTTRSS